MSSNLKRREDYVGQGNNSIAPKTAGSRGWSSAISMIFIILVIDQKFYLFFLTYFNLISL
jgi:hypothetical protein